MGSHFKGSGIGVNAESRNALLRRYLSRKDVPTQVKVWLTRSLSYPEAQNVIPEDLLLDVWTEFLAMKEIAFFHESVIAGLESTPIRNESGKVTGMKTVWAKGSGRVSLLMTGRGVRDDTKDVSSPGSEVA